MAKNNDFKAVGTVISEPQLDYECNGESFFSFFMKAKRTSGVFDIFQCRISGFLTQYVEVGKELEIYGEIRTYNRSLDDNRKLVVYVWVKEIYTPAQESVNENTVLLDGFICKPPVLRSTQLGKLICDVILAVNRPHGLSSYIPCIFWGSSAEKISELKVGDEVSFRGRLQSREYKKETENGIITRTVWEVSAQTITEVENNED